MRTDRADPGRISVVIPAYNAAKFLTETLRSALNQSPRPCEIIVVDDGSTDGTPELARSFGVTVITRANAGVSAARNAGTAAARGDYIAYLDADDVWLPGKLAAQCAALASCRRPAFSFTDYRRFDEHGPWRRTSELRAHWAFRRTAGRPGGRPEILIEARGPGPVLYDSYIPPSALLVRRADVVAVGGFDETLRAAEDYEFLLRLFKRLPAIAVMRPLLLYRQHAGQVTAKGTTMQAGFFAVARRVAASPTSYPPGDARYLARTEHLRHYRVGVQQARTGALDKAAESFVRSVRVRWNIRAVAALALARIGGSPAGHGAFLAVRALWKRRPAQR